jgi:hypothetical protein
MTVLKASEITDFVFYITEQYYLKDLFLAIKSTGLVRPVEFCKAGIGNILPQLVDMEFPLNFNGNHAVQTGTC